MWFRVHGGCGPASHHVNFRRRPWVSSLKSAVRGFSLGGLRRAQAPGMLQQVLPGRIFSRGNFRYNRSRRRHSPPIAPLAQLDRASGYEPEGREFESLRAHHSKTRKLGLQSTAFVLGTPFQVKIKRANTGIAVLKAGF